jgi:hypothetical protein
LLPTLSCLVGNDYILLDFLIDFHRHVRIKLDGKTHLKSERYGSHGIAKAYDRVYLITKYINHEYNVLNMEIKDLESALKIHEIITKNAYNHCDKEKRHDVHSVAIHCFKQYNGMTNDDKYFDYDALCKNQEPLKHLFSSFRISSDLISMGFDRLIMWGVSVERTMNRKIPSAHLVWEKFRIRFYAFMFYHDQSPFYVSQNTTPVHEYLTKKNSYQEHIVEVVKDRDYDILLGKGVNLLESPPTEEKQATLDSNAKQVAFMRLWGIDKSILVTLIKEKLMKNHYLALVCVMRYLVRNVWNNGNVVFTPTYNTPTRKAHKQHMQKNGIESALVQQWQFEILLAALCIQEPNDVEMHIRNCSTDIVSVPLENDLSNMYHNRDMYTHLIGDNGLHLLAQFQVGIQHLQLSNEFLMFPLGEMVVTKAALLFSGNIYLALHKIASAHYTEKGFDDTTVCNVLLKTAARQKRFTVLRSCILQE